MIKINLGSGPDGVKGWINYDWGWLPFLGKFKLIEWLVKFGLLPKFYNRSWPSISLHDLRKGIPLPDNSVEWIYSSNFFEHLDRWQARRLMVECWRVLKNHGKIRIVVPDLGKIIDKYKENPDATVFNREYAGFDCDNVYGFKRRFVRGHLWMYDFLEMKKLLNEGGFTKIKKSAFGTSRMPDIKKLDLKIHRELGLYIEAEKISSVG